MFDDEVLKRLTSEQGQTYEIVAIETFEVRTVYHVRATSPEHAERLCQSGRVPYDSYVPTEYNDEWVSTEKITQVDVPGYNPYTDQQEGGKPQ